YGAMRKYEESDRVVYVWRVLMEGQGELSGYHNDETGWLRVRPEDPALGKFCNSTIIEGYARFVPFCAGRVPNAKVTPDRFADIVAKTSEKQVNELGRILEQMLLGKTQLDNSNHEIVRSPGKTSDILSTASEP
ncbi:hypothetical protein PHMEG_00033522, partial [Phytophthora megakarya]